jgi:hypothetical protein
LLAVLLHIKYFIAFFVMVLVFQFNALNTASPSQFKTWKDGSEALILGKVFADKIGLDTGRSNLGFVEIGKITKSADVLAVYPRVDGVDVLMPADFSDENWLHGYSRTGNALILPAAATAELGYASNELGEGQKIILADGVERSVVGVGRSGNFLNVWYSGPMFNSAAEAPRPFKVLGDRAYVYDGYFQQFGIQAVVLSWIYRNVPLMDSVAALQFLLAIAMAAVISLLLREYGSSMPRAYGVAFFLCMIASPWMVSVARSLYWAPFLWFLPAWAAMLVYRADTHAKKRLALVFYGVTVFLKCLAGYEYISTIILFSLLVFMAAPFRRSEEVSIAQACKMVFVLGGVAVAGFIAAVVVHATVRAETLAAGLSSTLGWDALKYSALGRLTGTISSEAVIPLSVVLQKYISDWPMPVLAGLTGKSAFLVLVLFAIASLAAQLFVRKPSFKENAALLAFSSVAPLSWLVLMQNHSAIHVHLNYVLWSFGFLPALLSVIFGGGVVLVQALRKMRSESLDGQSRFLKAGDV